MNLFFKFFSSLKLTVALLLFAMTLVLLGTLAQVKLGLYAAQDEYFRSFFVWWKPNGANFRLPVFPGGWLLGTLLLINLIAAHVERFQFSKKKAGIFMTHAGLILLLLGQFLTEVYQVESSMRLREGEARNYAEDSFHNELAVIDLSFNAESNQVVSIPESMLKPGESIRHASLPFSIRVKEFYINSLPTGPMVTETNTIRASAGLGKRVGFGSVPKTGVMDDENKPAALIEIVSDKGVVGEWLVSTWFSKYPWNENLANALGRAGAQVMEPQTFEFNGRNYEIALRPIRYYKPYWLTLQDFRHDKYQGTDIPKNFSSKVHLSDPANHEERDVLIYMNNPLRYGGETFYQSGFMPGDTGTILQVVNNPAAVTPYVSCSLVGLGMLTQFLMHLIGFRRKNKAAATRDGANAGSNHQPRTAVPVAEGSL